MIDVNLLGRTGEVDVITGFQSLCCSVEEGLGLRSKVVKESSQHSPNITALNS